MKKKLNILLLIVFAFALFLNSKMGYVNNVSEEFTENIHIMAYALDDEKPPGNETTLKRPLATVNGKYCCLDYQTTKCSAVACSGL